METGFYSAVRATAPDTSVRIGTVTLPNLVMPASGCFGPELAGIVPVDRLGAVVTKTVFASERSGNPPARVSEIPEGMVNSVGIPSAGPAGYIRDLHPAYAQMPAPLVISVGGLRIPEYAQVIESLDGRGDLYELNVSCPNLDRTGTEIGSDPGGISEVVRSARVLTDHPLIVKLPPMVASVAECALAAQSAGADAVCVANSIPVLPLSGGRPILGNVIGGLTGPTVKVIVQRLVWLAAQAVDIPVIACGGVMTVEDVRDYLSLGAKAVQVGTAHFSNPMAAVEIADALALHPEIQALLGARKRVAENLEV